MTTTTTMHRRFAAAAVALCLLLAPGCATLSDLTRAEPAPSTASSPTVTAIPTPSPTPSPSPEKPSPSPTPTEKPSPSPSPSPTPSPSASPSAESSPEPSNEPDGDSDDDQKEDQKKAEKPEKAPPAYLEVGSDGAKVQDLQERLTELGYYLPGTDGAFGPQTQQAVWALQKAAGLYRDGVVGPKTRQALDDGVRPAAQSGSGKVVEIDLDRQLVLAVEDGQVVRTFNASSGNGEEFTAKDRTYRATTPTGTFAVYMERDYLHESTLELGSMYRPKYFTGAIAVHGSPSIPPYPASHGCIRVSNSAMDWLWDSWGMPQGTTVIVH